MLIKGDEEEFCRINLVLRARGEATQVGRG